jgi:hypothetical protein
VLPAVSVCEAIIFFAPSPFENSMATLNAPPTHKVDDGDAKPAPESATVKPVSQVPASVRPVCAIVFAAGDVIVILGPELSRINVRESESVLPAASVCVATTSLLPSPFENETTVLKLLAEHVVEDGDAKPAPERFTVRPVSHVPTIVALDETKLLAAGDVMAIAGATLSLIKLRLAEPELPAKSV